jgi:ABC-2 type transport system permease protein
MISRVPIAVMTLRSLLDRRRFWLMVLLAAVPVLIALGAAIWADDGVGTGLFDGLLFAAVVPLIALVFGTGALGTELEDGTIVYVLTKPIGRWRIVLAKSLVAAGLTVLLVVPATALTGLIASSGLEVTVAYAIAAGVGGTAYALGFLTLSSFTSRALAIGLGYVLLWEGALADLLPGTGMFSVRQAMQGLADELRGIESTSAVGGAAAIFVLAAVILGSLALATWRMSRYQLRGGD